MLRKTLPRITAALDAQKAPRCSWEIIVCDNHSTDGTAEVAAQLGARTVFEPVRQIARARNAGAAAAEGEWLLFIDSDSYPLPALMADVFEVIEDGRYLGCGSTVLVEGGTLFNRLRMERLNPLFRLFKLAGGAFLLCRADAFQAVGGFSAGLYAFEDLDFVLRLKRWGRKRGEKFLVLYNHPVWTSGRKGEPGSLGVLFLSNFAAVLLFGLHYLLPQGVARRLGRHLSAYWYGKRR